MPISSIDLQYVHYSKECSLCGLKMYFQTFNRRLGSGSGPINLELCGYCNEAMTGDSLEEDLLHLKRNERYLWNRIFSNNLGKSGPLGETVRDLHVRKS